MPHGLVHESEKKLRAHFFAHGDPLSDWTIFFGRQDELVVLVAERLEGGPVSSRVSTFPDVVTVQTVLVRLELVHQIIL